MKNKTLRLAALSAGAVLAGAGVASAQDAPAPPDQPPARPHTVVAGENLSGISEAELGTSDRWVEIFAFNRDSLANPDVIEVGQVLHIPLATVAVPADLLASLAAVTAPAPGPRRPPGTDDQGATRPVAVSSIGGGGGALAAIRACESGGDYGAVSSDGRYGGAYQFDLPTWQSVGGSGDLAAAAPAEQDLRADRLRSQRGSNPWPNCG